MKENKRKAAVLLAVLFLMCSAIQVFGSTDDGENGEEVYGWHIDRNTGKKYFYDRDGELHYGWLRHQGHWYYFTSLGNMVEGGYRSIDNVNYFFYNDGRLATGTFVGLHYMDENGVHQEKHDVRLIGNGDVTLYDRDMISDSLYYVPSKWVIKFIKDGWELMFYTKKKYIEAPYTNIGVYYMNYKLDTTYKKLKFTDGEELVRGFGEYIGYVLGLYEENNVQMDIMWKDSMTVSQMVEMPDYYENDPAFYFGMLCKLFWDGDTTKELEEAAPDTYAILKELIQ